MNRQKALLLIVLGIFACSLVYSFIRMPRQKSIEKLTYVSGMKTSTVKSVEDNGSDSTKLRLDLLEKGSTAGVSSRKNIFRALFLDEPNKKLVFPLPSPPPPPTEKILLPERVVEAPPQPIVAEPTVLQREMAKFTFLGFLKKDNRKTIFLSSDKEIFLVKKGDKIAGKYDVTSLTDENLTISSIQDGGEIIIPLVENMPLNAPKR